MIQARLNSLSPLVCSPSDDDQKVLSKVKEGNKELNIAIKARVKVSYDNFMSGSRSDTFDYVIMAIMGDDFEADDISIQEEFYEYYGAAPVCTWVLKSGLKDNPKVSALIKAHHEVFTFVETDNESKAKALYAAAKWGTALHDAKLKDDVTKAFKKFDQDDSGAIDKAELG